MNGNIFSSSVQVVVQQPLTLTDFGCQGIGGLAPAAPVLLVIAADQPQLLSGAQSIAYEIVRQLRSLTPGPAATAPCTGANRGPILCLAHATPSCRRVLVVVGDGGGIRDPSGAMQHWTSQIGHGHNEFILIPVAHQPNAATFGGALKSLSGRDYLVRSWSASPTEVVPEILRLAGITPAELRVFISYRREDGDRHADVLFDMLSRRGFEVFLDRVRLSAGADLLQRITEELLHKSIILVLETPKILKSPWVEQEVAYAQANRMGILAIQFPGGANVRNISPQKRILLDPADLDHRDMLTRAAAQLICEELIQLHDHWLTTRRTAMQQAMWNALLYHKVNRIKITEGGLVESRTKHRFVVGVSSRAAELQDFEAAYAAQSASVPIRHTAVLAPGALHPGVRQSQMRWLSNAIDVSLVDESLISDLAAKIEQGSSL